MSTNPVALQIKFSNAQSRTCDDDQLNLNLNSQDDRSALTADVCKMVIGLVRQLDCLCTGAGASSHCAHHTTLAQAANKDGKAKRKARCPVR